MTTLHERLAKIVEGLDDSIADGCADFDDLTEAELAANQFLSVESGNQGLWLGLHGTVAEAADANYSQETAGDWNLDTVIDVRDGSHWRAEPTWTAYPVGDDHNIITVPGATP